MMNELLFVYGSFSHGQEHFGKIASAVTQSFSAVAKGSMYRMSVGYPAFFNEGTTCISGSVVRLQKPDVQIALLDLFHGFMPTDIAKSIFIRREIDVESDERQVHRVLAYGLNSAHMSSATLLEDGDWLRALREKPALTQRLSDRQKTYVKRLGSSSGRAAAPIDLSLYRELINLGLIVDKGRRLALTLLGQDVHRFLS